LGRGHPNRLKCGGTASTPRPRYVYDANGNMESRNDGTTTWTLTWTAENMLQTVVNTQNNTVNLIYDADGSLIRRTEAGQDTVYVGRLYEHNLTTDSVRKHYVFNGRNTAVRRSIQQYPKSFYPIFIAN